MGLTSCRRYTAEFKRDAVALALSSGKTVTEVARDLGVSPEGLRPEHSGFVHTIRRHPNYS